MPTIIKTPQVAQDYCGWSNYETWCANLWLNNDEHNYRVLLDAKECGDSTYDQAKWLREQLQCQLEDEIDVPCMWRDLLQNAFERVNWAEIVEAV